MGGIPEIMSATLSTLLASLLKVGWLAIIFNEVRGVILAVPVLYGMYQAGGSAMAIWLGICSLGGIALSVNSGITTDGGR